jgi:hypothetical protein
MVLQSARSLSSSWFVLAHRTGFSDSVLPLVFLSPCCVSVSSCTRQVSPSIPGLVLHRFGGRFFSAQSFFSLREVLCLEPFAARKICLGWCRFLPPVVHLSIPAARYLLWMYAESSPCRQFWLDFGSLSIQVHVNRCREKSI